METALGLASRELLARVTNAIAETRTADILLIVDDLVMRGYDLRNFCRDLLAHLRDLLVVKVSDAPQLLDASAEERAALSQQAYYGMQPGFYNPYQTVSYQPNGYYYPNYYYPIYNQYYGQQYQAPSYWYQGR